MVVLENYMSIVKYIYALNALNRLIPIHEISEKDRRDKFYCPSCGKDLRPRLGIKRAHHFYHSQFADNNSCGFETYLHNVTKRLLYEELNERFDNNRPYYFSIFNLIKIIDDNGKVINTEYETDCSEYNILESCKKINLEKYIGQYKPDISLEYLDKDPLFLEIQVHHKSSWKKREENTIIEIGVKDENDIERVKNSIDENQDEAFNCDKFRKVIEKPQSSRLDVSSNQNKQVLSVEEQYSQLSILSSFFRSGILSVKIQYEIHNVNNKTPINNHTKIALNDFYSDIKLVTDNFIYCELSTIGNSNKLYIGFDQRIKERAIASKYIILHENAIEKNIVDQKTLKKQT